MSLNNYDVSAPRFQTNASPIPFSPLNDPQQHPSKSKRLTTTSGKAKLQSIDTNNNSTDLANLLEGSIAGLGGKNTRGIKR